MNYWENGYISQPIPMATARNIASAHRIYFARSVVPFLDRKANNTETTTAKSSMDKKWMGDPDAAST
jgi:hypothetical protein